MSLMGKPGLLYAQIRVHGSSEIFNSAFMQLFSTAAAVIATTVY